jgi:hypothetical protein
LFIRYLDPDFLPIPDPGSRIMGSKKHRILDPQHYFIARKFRKKKEVFVHSLPELISASRYGNF